MKVTLLENERSVVGRAINEVLEGAETFDAAVAFVKHSGLELAPELRTFAQSRRLRILAGTDFSLTEIEAVDELSQSGADSRVFVEGFARTSPPISARTFHPKIYLATQPRKLVAIVGSANLTRGGLSTNREACFRVEGDPEEPVLLETAQYFESLWNNPYAVPVNDTFREKYRQYRDARRRAERGLYDVARHEERILRSHLAALVTSRADSIGRGFAPRSWILVTSLANFEVCRERQWWGDIEETRIRKLRNGDAVIFYIKSVMRIGGLALVRGDPFPLRANPWPEGRYEWGIQVDFLLSPETTIDFVALVPSLSFIENKPAWGTHLQGFMRQVPYSDFAIMREALVQLTIGTDLPRVAESG